MNERCLVCSRECDQGQEYHRQCAEQLFGTFPPPVLDISLDAIQQLAAHSVLERTSVTGVQKKLSLHVEKTGKDARFTVVGLWGNFILKPPVAEYPHLPENEHLVMSLAAMMNIPTVPHGLIRLASGELAYITRRVDRTLKGNKLAMEDFCQISQRLTEDKYKGSVERVGKLLRVYSIYPGLDAVDLFERVVFNFICGNADMHLKNYSLVETPEGLRLSPAYDLLSTVLVLPGDPEESALTINGKKSHLTKKDFMSLAERLQIRAPAVRKTLGGYVDAKDRFLSRIETSHLPGHMKERLGQVIEERLSVFG